MNAASADRFPERTGGGLLPGWAVSVLLHAGLLAFAATHLKDCGGSGTGEADGGFRDVGIVLRSGDGDADSPNPARAPSVDEPRDEPDPLSTADAVPVETPPTDTAADTATPADLPPVLGPGSATGSTAAAPPATALDAGPRADAGRPGGAARPGVTDFFGIRDEADSFVYLLDRSGSMDNGGELAVAKRELLDSLASLTPKQRFQVVFYNDESEAMNYRSRMDGGFYWALDLNRTLAAQFVEGVSADGGTDPLPALRKALALEPDVIYFLTDAGDTKFYAGDFAKLDRANTAGTRVHCVEFGKTRRQSESSLERLAERTGGSYRFRDVRKFRR